MQLSHRTMRSQVRVHAASSTCWGLMGCLRVRSSKRLNSCDRRAGGCVLKSPDTRLWWFAEAALPAVLQSAQMRAIVNTVLALLGSCLSTFAASAFVDNRFNIMHVQVLLLRLHLAKQGPIVASSAPITTCNQPCGLLPPRTPYWSCWPKCLSL